MYKYHSGFSESRIIKLLVFISPCRTEFASAANLYHFLLSLSLSPSTLWLDRSTEDVFLFSFREKSVRISNASSSDSADEYIKYFGQKCSNVGELALKFGGFIKICTGTSSREN